MTEFTNFNRPEWHNQNDRIIAALRAAADDLEAVRESFKDNVNPLRGSIECADAQIRDAVSRFNSMRDKLRALPGQDQ